MLLVIFKNLFSKYNTNLNIIMGGATEKKFYKFLILNSQRSDAKRT